MNSLVCSSPFNLEYKQLPAPELTAGNAIIRIKNICICGTDLHAFEGTQPYFNYPRILGHELSGELVDADAAPGFNKGDLVTIIPYFNCGDCLACRSGKSNCCSKLRVCGVHIDGGMVEYLSVPSYSLVKAEGLNSQQLAMVEPLAIGAHGVRRAGISTGENVLVMGAGPIGLGAAEFARIAGANVIMLDINEYRLRFAQNQLGIEKVIHAGNENVMTQLELFTNAEMPAIVMDATGNQEVINQGLAYLAHSGRYVLIGLQKKNLEFSHPEFHKRETTLMSSRNATREDFDKVIFSIKNNLLNPTAFVTEWIKFDSVKESIGDWLHSPNLVKIGIEMD
jgi:2-desacetyl-2-hydroxyethyl bacteriochlorophyllide A dehydrogenase